MRKVLHGESGNHVLKLVKSMHEEWVTRVGVPTERYQFFTSSLFLGSVHDGHLNCYESWTQRMLTLA